MPLWIRTAAVLIALAVPAPAEAAPTWLAPADLTADSDVSQASRVAMSPDGTAVVAWTEYLDGGFVARAARRRPGGAFGPATTLSDPAKAADAVDVGIDDAGNATVVWQETAADGNGRIRAARLPVAGASFERPQYLTLEDVSATEPHLGVGANGAAAVLWLQAGYSDQTLESVVRPGAAGPFVDTRPISQTGSAVQDAHVAVDASGGAVATWSGLVPDVLLGTVRKVLAAVRPAGGSFATAGTVISSPGVGDEATAPTVVVDRSGRATALWQASNTRAVEYAERGPAGDWSRPGPVSQTPGGPSIAAAAADDGTVIAAWSTDSGSVEAASRAPGGGFKSEGAVTSPLASPEWFALDVGPHGDAVVLWVPEGQAAVHSRRRPPGGEFGPRQDAVLPAHPAVHFILPAVAVDDEGNALGAWTREEDVAPGQQYRVQAGGLDAAPPRLDAVAVPAGATAGTSVAMTARATDRWSGAGVSWAFGDGAAGEGPAVSHVFSAGSFAVTARATDGAGNVASVTRGLLVTDPPAEPPPPPPDLDGDDDGVQRPADCNDANPAIHPGAIDIPLNRIDEDCRGGDAPAPRIGASISATFGGPVEYATFDTLVVSDVPAGATLRLSCTGRGCASARKPRTQRVKTARRRLNVIRLARGVRLYRRTRVELRVTLRGTIGVARRWTGLRPKVVNLCLPPQASRPVRC